MIQKTTPKDNQRLCYYLNLDSVDFGSTDYGRAIAHELGHYVFILGDEYMDWHGKIYYNPKDYGILDSLWFYKNTVPPRSIMNNAHKYSELSWPADYERFNSELRSKFGDKWKEHLTDQWGNYTKEEYSTLIRKESGWTTLYKVLTMWKGSFWIPSPTNPKVLYRVDNQIIRNNLQISISSSSEVQTYIPRTGPYTGVGYFMEVIWG